MRILFLFCSIALAYPAIGQTVSYFSVGMTNSFSQCLQEEFAKIELARPFGLSRYISCEKARPLACSTEWKWEEMDYTSPPEYVISSATARAVPARHAREVSISRPAQISQNKKQVNAQLHCKGWGCDPDEGGSPGTGHIEGIEQRVATRFEVSKVMKVCADKLSN